MCQVKLMKLVAVLCIVVLSWSPSRAQTAENSGNITIKAKTTDKSGSASKSVSLEALINGNGKKYQLCNNQFMNRGATETFTIKPAGNDTVVDFITIDTVAGDAWGPESFVFEFPDGKIWTFSGKISLGSNKAKILKSDVRPSITFFFTGAKAGTCLTQTEYTKEDPPWAGQLKGVCTTAPPADGQPATASGKTTTMPVWEFNGHSYRLFHESISWHAAKKRCEEMGGYLVCIESAEENDFLFSNINIFSGAFYIGATDESKEGNWEWVNGSKFEYTSWQKGEPNNCYRIENYAAFAPASCGAMWNDLPGFVSKGRFVTRGFICEWNRSADAGSTVENTKKVPEKEVVKSPELTEFEDQLDYVEKSFWIAASLTRNDPFSKNFEKKLFEMVVLSRSIQTIVVSQHQNNNSINMPKETMRLTEVWKKFSGKGIYRHRKLVCTSRRSYGLYQKGSKQDYLLWLENKMLQNIKSFNSSDDGAINTRISDYYMAIKELRCSVVELSYLGIFAENPQLSIPDKLNEIDSGGEPANNKSANGKTKALPKKR